MTQNRGMRVFAGRHSKALAEKVCRYMGMPLGDARTHVFPDGELLVKLEEDVRGRDCFVISSTSAPVNDNLMELLIFTDCLRRASARRVTLVIPYYGYARQDRKSEGRTPITAKLIANMIAAGGADRVLTIDLHAAQIQGFFDIPVDHLSATEVFLDYFESIKSELGNLCLVSPDVGNVKVAEGLAQELHGEMAIINKQRLSGEEIKTGNLIGSVQGKTVLMFDDMISTGGTICKAADLVIKHGASEVIVAAPHAVLAGLGAQRLAQSPVTRVIVSDTIPMSEDKRRVLSDKLVELSVGPLLGDAIRRIHENRSVSAIFRRAEMKR
ncbi:MAG: ribose-phosphate pyrophosphokinase [Phycisphaerales bacterium]|nr:ribose-phosphate pyrophosphokinase [Phycisphaerales bacterium]